MICIDFMILMDSCQVGESGGGSASGLVAHVVRPEAPGSCPRLPLSTAGIFIVCVICCAGRYREVKVKTTMSPDGPWRTKPTIKPILVFAGLTVLVASD